MSRSWRNGSTRRWRNLRAAVLLANMAENQGRCVLNVGVWCPRHSKPCVDVCEGQATQVHHRKGKAHGDRIEDLVPSCGPCNGHVGRPGSINPEPKPVSRW